MPTVHHRYATVDGHRLFYREAGDADAPALVLFTDFRPVPTCSAIWSRARRPLPRDRTRPLGFGLSDAPPVDGVRLHLRRA